jgi:serine/threonine protein kinase
MNKISPQLFQERFKLTSEIMNPVLSEKKAYYRDILHRRNVMVYKHSFEVQDDVKRGLDRLSRTYNPVHCVELIGYVHIQSEKSSKSTLLLIYNHCSTLEEFIYEANGDRVKLLSLREILYIFTSVVKLIIYLEGKDTFHGCIDDANLYVDEGGRVKCLPRLEEETNLMFFLRARQHSARTLPTLLSPEFMVAAREPSNKTWNWKAKDVNRSDLFSLGLLCVRLISPRAFNEGYSLSNLEIDFNRLYILIDTLGTFVDNSFGGILKQCLSFDPAFRPEPFFLMEEINANHSYPPNLLEVMNRPYESQNYTVEYQTAEKHQKTGSRSTSEKKDGNLYESKHEEGSVDDRLQEVRRGGLLAQLPTKPLTKTIKLLHRKEYDEKDLFTNSDKNMELERLKAECLHFIENKIFDNLPHRNRTEFNNRGTKHVIKTMRDGVQIGFIIYPNNNIYFGYIHECRAEDLGMLFLDNKRGVHR